MHHYKTTLDKKIIKIPSKTAKGEDKEIELLDCMSLLCYDAPETSELAFMLSLEQRQIIASLVNNELLSNMNLVFLL